jgi:hypothetical protein
MSAIRKVTVEQRHAMLQRVYAGEMLQAIATDYGVTMQRVHQIVTALDPQSTKLGKAIRLERTRVAREVEWAKRQAAKPQRGVLIHGTDTGYRHHGCRCDACCAAGRTYLRTWRARQTSVPANAPHGSLSTYQNYRCRCADCRAAVAEASRRRRARARRGVVS